MKAPGHVTVTDNVDRAKAGQAATIAFYAARMGTFYSEQLTRFGFGDEVQKVKQAWDAGGSKAGTAALSPKMLSELGYIGGIEGALERLKEQEKAGVDLHPVEIDAQQAGRVREDRRAPALMIARTEFADSLAKALYRNRMRHSRRTQATMKAAVFEGTKKPLVVKTVPDPECAPNSAIVRVEANGVCRSDWHAWSGDWTGWDCRRSPARSSATSSPASSRKSARTCATSRRASAWWFRSARATALASIAATANPTYASRRCCRAFHITAASATWSRCRLPT